MDDFIKQRLLGAVVIIGLAIIFLPVILDRDDDSSLAVTMEIPQRPDIVKNIDIEAKLDEREAVFEEQVVIQPEELEIDSSELEQKTPTALKLESEKRIQAAIPEAKEENVEAPVKPVVKPKPVSKPVKPIKPVVKNVDYWVVQLGSFSKRDNAEKLQAKLKPAYSNIYIEQVKIPGGNTYRLRLGDFADKNKAIQQRRRIKSKFNISGVVMAKE